MKKVLLVLGLVLLSGLLFAEADPLGPSADPSGAMAGDPSMFWYTWRFMVTHEVQGQPEDPIQFMKQTRNGDPDTEPAGAETPKEPQTVQARSGDCTSDCDGEPDQSKTQEQTQDKLQDGSCNDEPAQDRTQSGKK
jgi:hypothetical protein